jgi:hypothetical protein
MPEFMLLIHESEAAVTAVAPRQMQALLERQSSYEQTLRSASAYVEGERLRPSAEGRRVTRRKGGASAEHGPFAEPTLEAYYVVRAEDLDAALELAAQCPLSPGATLEVRPVMKGRFEPEKTSLRGRVFAFAVLGTAPNERSWVEIMDRIDESWRWCTSCSTKAIQRVAVR